DCLCDGNESNRLEPDPKRSGDGISFRVGGFPAGTSRTVECGQPSLPAFPTDSSYDQQRDAVFHEAGWDPDKYSQGSAGGREGPGGCAERKKDRRRRFGCIGTGAAKEG